MLTIRRLDFTNTMVQLDQGNKSVPTTTQENPTVSIQQLIAAGKQRKEENEQQIQEDARRKEEERRKVNKESWSMIFDEVSQLMPEELHHVLVAPDYPALSSDSGRYRSQPFTIDLPENAGKIWCDTDTRWNGRNSITFQAMAPYVDFDEGSNAYEVYWRKDYEPEQTDFLIALAEAAALAEQLPAAINECQNKNAAWQAQSKQEPAPAVDWLAEAEQYYHQTTESTIAAALIAIAQELRAISPKMDYRF